MSFIIQHNGQQSQIKIESDGTSNYEEIFSSILLQTAGNKDWDHVYLRWVNEPFSALDIDTDTPIDLNQIHYYALNTSPTPAFYWRTHGGGMRFIYYDYDGFQAKELAVLALGFMYRKWPQFSYEIKNDTRHPGYSKNGALVSKPHIKPIEFNKSTYITSYVQLNKTDEEVTKWLAERGYGESDRFPHSQCPFNPDETESRNPVQIFNDGILCYKCKGQDKKYFAKWGELLGKLEYSTLDLMIRNLTHWAQADIILTKLIGPMPHLDLYYKTLIKLYLISTFEDIDQLRLSQILKAVFNKGSSLLRYEGYWATVDHRMPDNGLYLKRALEQLPLFLMHNDKSLILALCSDTVDFSQYGYPPITAVQGYPMNNVHIGFNRFLKVVSSYPKQPEYLPNVTESQLEQAWSTLEAVFPGINRNLIYLLLAGKGITEYPYNIPHILYIWGPTAAAKTSSVKLAGAICGSTPIEFPWQRDEHYLGTKFLNGCRNSAFILINEVAKVDVDYNFLLSLDSNKTVHQLHYGPTKLHRLPLIVLTDIVIADGIQRSAQYRRRINFIRLNQSVDWAPTMHQHGLTSIGEIRDKYPEACNTILSYTIDRFFNDKRAFLSVFEELGFAGEQDEMEYIRPKDKIDDMYLFYLAFCKTCKPASGSDAQRWKGHDTRVFSYTDNSLVADLWRQYTGTNPKDIQVFMEQDWSKILQVDEPIELVICRFNGSKTGVRFVGKTTGKTNEKIIGDRWFNDINLI